jgi:hypothetical protein
VSETSAYTTIGIDGGMIGPMMAADAVIAAAYATGYFPSRVIMPMMIRPMPTASAIAEPDMPAKMTLETTFTCPSPPRRRPTRTRQKRSSRSVRLPVFIRSAARMNKGTASST